MDELDAKIKDIRDKLRTEHEALDRFEKAILGRSEEIRGHIRRIHRVIDQENANIQAEVSHMLASAGVAALPAPEEKPKELANLKPGGSKPPTRVTGYNRDGPVPPLPHQQNVAHQEPEYMPRILRETMEQQNIDEGRYSFKGNLELSHRLVCVHEGQQAHRATKGSSR